MNVKPTPRPDLRVVDPETAERRSAVAQLTAPATNSVRFLSIGAGVLTLSVVALAAFVPIASGVVAPGQVAVEGSRKVVQHPTGGIIAEIKVREGQMVAQGEVLLRLDSLQAAAQAGIADAQVDSLRAEAAVRRAEIAGRQSATFPADLEARRQSDPEVAAIVEAHEGALRARATQAWAVRSQLEQQIAQVNARAASSLSQQQAITQQLSFLREEVEALRPLLEKQLVQKSRVLALDRSIASAEGQIAALGSEIREHQARVRELQAQRARVEVDRRAEAANVLSKIEGELAGALNRQVATSDVVARTDVKAPASGRVVALQTTTVGGVVQPGAPLMDIVPDDTRLVIRAQIRPQDADDVRAGQPTTVRFDALSSKKVKSMEGEVDWVSADALTDPKTGAPYFEVAVSIPEKELRAKSKGEAIAPGLPAEVLVRTGSRTMLQYLFKPIENAMWKAARES